MMVKRITEEEMEEMYDEMLDETFDSWYKNYNGAKVLKEVDPIAYNCGYSDFEDSVSDEFVVEGGDYDEEDDEEEE